MRKQILIIGAGPSGLMASISAKMHHSNANVILFERNRQVARKLMLTGGGRCNVTANVDNDTIIKNTPKNGKFLYSTLSNFNSKNIVKFFEENNCILKEEDHNRMFPKTNKAIDIIKTLENKAISLGVDIKYNTYIKDINLKNREVYTTDNKFLFNNLIIATGGKTYPMTGSDGNGYDLAQTIGHKITELLPAEVPLVSNDAVIHNKTLQGLSFKDAKITVYKKNKRYKEITHDLLFTHFGISGPAALRASFYVQKVLKKSSVVDISIDFIPEENILNTTKEELDNILNKYNIPKRLIKHLMEDFNIDIRNLLKKYPMTVYDTRGFKHAFVTNGGVNTKEIDPSSLKSKINSQISFCGEIIDYNAYTGGFNITAALSTGYTAGLLKK